MYLTSTPRSFTAAMAYSLPLNINTGLELNIRQLMYADGTKTNNTQGHPRIFHHSGPSASSFLTQLPAQAVQEHTVHVAQ